MKTIFITRENSQMPGVRVRCHGFAGYLRKAQIDAEVFSYADSLGAKSGKDESKMSLFDKCAYNLKAYRKLAREDAVLVLQRFNYHSFAPFFLRLFNKRKLIFDLDDWEAREEINYYFNKVPSSKAEIMMRFIAKKSNFCIAASKFLVKFLSVYNDNVIYMPTGVDVDVFKPVVGARIKPDMVISWLGTMHRPDNVENIKFLIDCFLCLVNDYPRLRLEIRGDGIFYGQVRDFVRQHGQGHICLKPWINPEQIPAYLNKIDIGVMPLIQETKFNKAKSPTRLFEYMAMEKPVLASSIGEAREIINDGENGLLAKTKDDFIIKMKALIENASLRKSLGKCARKSILRGYTLEQIAGKLIKEIKLL